MNDWTFTTVWTPIATGGLDELLLERQRAACMAANPAQWLTATDCTITPDGKLVEKPAGPTTTPEDVIEEWMRSERVREDVRSLSLKILDEAMERTLRDAYERRIRHHHFDAAAYPVAMPQ